MEAIVLAGGFGTRLKCITGDLPKPLADVCGKPFLSYVLNYLVGQKIERIILSTGYRHDAIEAAFGSSYRGVAIEYIVEREPLGTGGAIRKAFSAVRDDCVSVVNGDTFFAADISTMEQLHRQEQALATLALKPLTNFNRYGVVKVEDRRIVGFEEKGVCDCGYVNGGIYLMSAAILPYLDRCGKIFSFEADFLQKRVSDLRIAAFISDAYFIDIGIPSDYERAQQEFAHLDLSKEIAI
jgi:D-glycero-alpha-D-manno-heptose 1-phosphate guanylyltransferase